MKNPLTDTIRQFSNGLYQFILREAAQAVITRYENDLWKTVEVFRYQAIRKALDLPFGGKARESVLDMLRTIEYQKPDMSDFMQKLQGLEIPELPETGSLNPYGACGDRCGLSEKTIRTAFAGRPITYQTACKIAKHLQIPVECFRIKADNRGQNKRPGLKKGC